MNASITSFTKSPNQRDTTELLCHICLIRTLNWSPATLKSNGSVW
uniref:Uncharacterized protein n=1 Tax=Rhizophora mucronata TaxID=61149 RepID=A0A2P2L6Q5_RHIMU